MLASRVVYAVGSISGWPPEVFAIYANVDQARRHANGSAYLFDVFALPVYETYEDCPEPWRLTDSGRSSASAPHRLLVEEIASAELRMDSPPLSDADPVLWAVGSHEDSSPEVWVLYENTAEAARHVDAAYFMLRAFPVAVYENYEACPPERRFTESGPPLSQLIKPRDGAPRSASR